MTIPCDSSKPSPCDCPEEVDIGHTNEPGQPEISYRLGTHSTFLNRMLGKIHTNELLREKLTTRENDDPSIALLDAWAVVLDVLTFYQERIANEGYLHTATERRSILEMARTIGYELNPGVAASTYLAFTVDDTDERYATVTISQGTQIQSIPAQGELPQTFETSEEFTAHVEWNTLKPRQTRHQTLGIGSDDKLYFLAPADSSSSIIGDFYIVNPDSSLEDSTPVIATEVNTLYLDGIATKLEAGDIILLAGKKGEDDWNTFIRPIVSVEIDKELNRTVVQLSSPSQKVQFVMATLAPILYVSTGLSFNATQVQQNVLAGDISETMMNALITINSWNQAELLQHVTTVQSATASVEAKQGVFAFREHVGFFGNNAPDHDAVDSTIYSADWDATGWEIWKSYPSGNLYSGADVYLERKVEGIAEGSWALLECPSSASQRYKPYLVSDIRDESITGFSLSGKATGLSLNDIDGGAADKPSEFKVRNTTAYVESERLDLVQLPIEEDLEEEADSDGSTTTVGVTQVMLDSLVLGLQIGQPVIVSGEQVETEGVTSHEVAILKNIIHSRGYTVLFFEEALQYRYVRDTVTISANVVPATHGETVTEVLGSGDGTKTNQRFKLKKPPLTYVSASTPSGAESTLTVKVDDLEWEESSSLYGLDARSQQYTVRLDNEANAYITFGDGKQGARLPTGEENVTATYRSGIGYDGEVDADSLKLLKTKPQGIRSVTNPVAASGADEPETMDKARTNAPLTVLTMDRIVSLKDYEDFARAFTGIGKAQAIILWNGESELVHITIASSSGKTIDSTSQTYENLVEAIETYRNPIARVQVATFESRLFHVEAKIMIDSRYTESTVLDEAKAALESAFSFDERDFGQSVTAAEVINVIQQVAGVVYVDLEKLYLADDAEGSSQTSPPVVLKVNKARWPQGGAFQKAQLLLINSAGITLEAIES